MGFVALGDTAIALAAVGCTRGMEAVLPRVADQVREAITAPRGRARPHCPEALQVRLVSCRKRCLRVSAAAGGLACTGPACCYICAQSLWLCTC